jgi:uncharacterized repeat protein (TIGR01451 family)
MRKSHALNLIRLGEHALLSVAFLLTLMLGHTSEALAQGQFVYVNNNDVGPNTVSAFSVGANFALTPVAGSPFLTGGIGGSGGLFAAQRAEVCAMGDFLYVTNQASSNISVLAINPATGALTPVAGSPFPVPGSGDISVACTPNGQFLLAARSSSHDIAVFSRGAGGSLTQVAGSPFAAGGSLPVGVKVTPDGRFVIVTLLGSNAVAVFSIDAGGVLTQVAGSPFPVAETGLKESPAGVAINCAGSIAYIGFTRADGTRVDALSIGSTGALTPIAGSPFTAEADVSNVVLLSPDNRFLFVSNQFGDSITVFSVNGDGSLSEVAGSPFLNGSLSTPQQMVTNVVGTGLFVSNGDGTLSVYSIAANGALTRAVGSPYFTANPSVPGIAIYPAVNCAAADLSVTKRVTDQTILGSTASYEINVTNQGPAVATNVVVTDMLPAGTSFAAGSCMTTIDDSPAGTCQINAGVLTASFPLLAAGQVATVKYSVQITVEGPLTNTASVSSDSLDLILSNNTVSVTLQQFDVCLQDDSNPSTVLQFSTVTGEYRFCCNGSVVTGRGKITKKGGNVTLSNTTSSHRVSASASLGTTRPTGKASLQSPAGSTRCTITDRDLRNNSCLCGQVSGSRRR